MAKGWPKGKGNFEVVVKENKKGHLPGLNKNIALMELRFHVKL